MRIDADALQSNRKNTAEFIKLDTRCRKQDLPGRRESAIRWRRRGLWRDTVVKKDAASCDRINRVTYKVAVLEALREQLRCKENWIGGTNRYRNPQ
jgi:hypothetical protein